MILALCLLALSEALLLLGPSLLERWTAGGRAPLASLVAWQFAGWSVVANVALAAALLGSPSLAAVGRLPNRLESCLVAVHHLANPADSLFLQTFAAGALGCLLLRLLGCSIRSTATNRRLRARHRALLNLVGRPDAFLGAHVIFDPTAMAYCLPGRGGRVVITSAAVEKLTAAQRAAVLAHERAHLRGRHHLLVASASLLTRAFPHVRLFRHGLEHTARLVEMHADDLASRSCGRRSVAEALLALGVMDSSAMVLAASAVTTAARIDRLLAQQPTDATSGQVQRARRAAGAVLGASILAASPLLLAAASHAALCLL